MPNTKNEGPALQYCGIGIAITTARMPNQFNQLQRKLHLKPVVRDRRGVRVTGEALKATLKRLTKEEHPESLDEGLPLKPRAGLKKDGGHKPTGVK